MKENILKIIKEKYNIVNNSSYIKQLKYDYPHILELNTYNKSYIIKIISKKYCILINELYKNLSNLDCVLIPMKTNDNQYYINYNNQFIIIYNKIFEINNIPSPMWWAKSLNKIHSLNINHNNFYDLNSNIYEETIKLYNIASKYLDTNIKDKFRYLLNQNGIIIDNEVCLCHCDPNNRNVMFDNGIYKLIDTDGMRLLPKEYDIQRLLQNQVNNTKTIDEVLNFWNKFYSNYLNKIDIYLLKQIYIYDMIRIFSWLTIVSNNLSRVDRVRQTKELELYKESLKKDKHLILLKKL